MGVTQILLSIAHWAAERYPKENIDPTVFAVYLKKRYSPERLAADLEEINRNDWDPDWVCSSVHFTLKAMKEPQVQQSEPTTDALPKPRSTPRDFRMRQANDDSFSGA